MFKLIADRPMRLAWLPELAPGVNPFSVADSLSIPASSARVCEMRCFGPCQSMLPMAVAVYLGHEQQCEVRFIGVRPDFGYKWDRHSAGR
jgi:hypothetical protein